MKRNRILIGFFAASTLWGMSNMLLSCTDWDDHYGDSGIMGSSNATLWENISSNAQFSNFAALLKQEGYDKVLNSDQTFTVWAPLDGTFNNDSLANLSDSKLKTQFIQNHIARSSYSASGSVNDQIYMMNEKRLNFKGNGSYTISNVEVEDPNISSSNGILHALGGLIPFRHNIYESLNSDIYPIDSLSDFYHSYDRKVLDESKSTAGPTVDGEMTYLDSVFDESNALYSMYAQYINREDSNYSMLIPTNQAWVKAKKEINPFYNYIGQYNYVKDIPSYFSSTVNNSALHLNIDANYLRDSIIHENLLRDLCYNNNRVGNRALSSLGNGESLNVDSLVSTTYSIIYHSDAEDLFNGAAKVEKSNGSIWITDSLRMRPWTSWNPLIKVEAESSKYQAAVFNGSVYSNHVSSTTQNSEVSGSVSQSYYAEVDPSSSATNPVLVMYLPSVRSTTYEIYVVFVPGNITNSNAEVLPNRFQASMGYNTTDGKLAEKVIGNNLENDPSKIDTLDLGEFTFPVSYYGISDIYPYLRISSRVTTSLSSKYSRTLRIDCILLVPKELDTYVKEHPEYKYYQGN